MNGLAPLYRARRPDVEYDPRMPSPAPRLLGLIPFLALVLGGGLAIGIVTAPGPWYASLAKPSFNPPGWIFGPAWSVLYVLIAIAGWRLWNRARSSAAMKLWWLQLVLNRMAPTGEL